MLKTVHSSAKDTALEVPVAIGGLGGSGTRVVAEILKNAGYYLGDTLNPALDNLWFTLLLKRRTWMRSFPADNDIIDALTLFKRAMQQGLGSQLSGDELNVIDGLIKQGGKKTKRKEGRLEILDALKSSTGAAGHGCSRWGWKEPNTHVFLPYLIDVFGPIKYIHVIRHGLDMAFSKNQQQLNNWGARYGVAVAKGSEPSPSQALDYWIAANNQAIEKGQQLLGRNFLLLNYDALCSQTASMMEKIVEFLDIELSRSQAEKIHAMTIGSSSIGRYRDHNLQQFSTTQLQAVQDLGFKID